ncbi:hypothetical protein [Streptomyces cinereoruber]|uniref:hypothetical protein n=1 Tax=Streptomyces cinereoruber TaxID=67260 RepID=UPI003638D52E
MADELWSRDEIAAHLGIAPGSVRQAVRRMGLTPVDYTPGLNGRPMARYDADAVRKASAQRPGQGTRTDRPNASRMAHPLAAIHAHMPAALRAETPLTEWPQEAQWESPGRSGTKTWCETDRHDGQQVPAAKHEVIYHDGHDENDHPFRDIYASWKTCTECHDLLAHAHTVRDAEGRQ